MPDTNVRMLSVFISPIAVIVIGTPQGRQKPREYQLDTNIQIEETTNKKCANKDIYRM